MTVSQWHARNLGQSENPLTTKLSPIFLAKLNLPSAGPSGLVVSHGAGSQKRKKRKTQRQQFQSESCVLKPW